MEIKEHFKEDLTENSINTKASVGKQIFKRELEWDALEIIITSDVDKSIVKKAKDLLDKRAEYNKNLDDRIGIYTISSKYTYGLALELFYWILDQPDLVSCIKIIKDEAIQIRSNSENNYRCKQFGSGIFIKEFKNKASSDDLINNSRKRFFDDPITLDSLDFYKEDCYYYISNQWTYNQGSFSLSKMINFIQESSSDYELTFEGNKIIINDKTISILEKEFEDESFFEEDDGENKEHTNLCIDKFKYDETELLKRNKKITLITLQDIFIARLKTQNRKYKSGIYFFPLLFNRLIRDCYNDCMESQLLSLKIYAEDKTYKLQNFDSFILKKGSIFGIIVTYDDKPKKEEKELFFKVGNNEPTSFTSFIRDIKDVYLEHTLSMYQILNELNDINKIP